MNEDNDASELADAPFARLSRAALLALGCHLVAGLSMALILRHGLETNSDLKSRLEFVAERRNLWIAGWFTWNVAAASIVYFYHSFHVAHSKARYAGALRLALVFSGAGLAADLSAEAIEMGVLPEVAALALQESPPAAGAFLLLHRAAVMLTGYLGNGLYSVAALILAWSSRGAYPGWVSLSGLTTGIAGLSLCVAALYNSVEGLFWTNAVLVPCLLLWLGGIARVDGRR